MSYGKHFASMYSGSLFGKPAIVFAVWGYVIANMRPSRKDSECYVEVNPTLLAATFAATVPEVIEALATLEAPDPASRTKKDEGRRLVLIGDQRHSGPMQFRVVNGPDYRAARDDDDRREYLREAKRASRARKGVNVNNVNHGQPPSTQAEAEAEAKAEAEARNEGETETAASAAGARTPNGRKRRRAKTEIHPEWTPNETTLQQLQAEFPRHDVGALVRVFRDVMLEDAAEKGDFDATFRSWTRNRIRREGTSSNRSNASARRSPKTLAGDYPALPQTNAWTPEPQSQLQRDEIREAALILKFSTDPLAAKYVAWLTPDGDGDIRPDALTFDQWKASPPAKRTFDDFGGKTYCRQCHTSHRRGEPHGLVV